jgi:hypothetical protein
MDISLLQFYPYNVRRLPTLPAPAAVAPYRRAPRAHVRIAIVFAAALVAAGCASTPPSETIPPARGSTTPIAPNAEPPPPNVNLSGFPLPYRQGYADGCASAGGRERKDAARFASDGNYRTGWTDGAMLCKKK